jgi:hypothetical protein
MNWYYADGNQKKGPFSESEFKELLKKRVINLDTLVWREGLDGWVPLSRFVKKNKPAEVRAEEPLRMEKMQCSECGSFFPRDQLVPIENKLVCASCKPIVIQKLKEGVNESQAKMTDAPLTLDEGYRTFIGNNADKYIMHFNQFNLNGIDKFSFTWHWPAFFVPVWWMVYRKLYLWALLSFLLSFVFLFIPCVGPILQLLFFALIANYLYYKHVRQKIAAINQSPMSNITRRLELTRAGGVNLGVAIVVSILLFFVIAGILASIAIPQFYMYRNRAYNAIAYNTLNQAISAQEAYFIDNGKYTDSIEELSTQKYGCTIPKGVVLKIIYADDKRYIMESVHEKGNKKYVINRLEEKIKELPKGT